MALTRPRAAHRLLVLTAALLIALALTALFPGGLRQLDDRLTDLGWRLAAGSTPEERLVIIDIDEKGLAELGPWPWPQERLAELAERLGQAGAALQIWDLVLDTPRPGRDRLAAALRQHDGLLAVAFALPGQGEAIDSGSLDPQAAIGTLSCAPLWPQALGQRAPEAGLAGLPAGHIVPRIDADGIVRALPAYVCRQGVAWPALPLAAWLKLSTEKGVQLVAGRGPLDPPWQLRAEGLPEPIPLGAGGELYVPYARSPQAFVAFSAADVLAGHIPAERLAGRIVLVGSTALGLADRVMTPFAAAQGGVLVHAELLSGLLDGRLPHPPRSLAALQAFTALGAALLLMLLASRRPAAWALPAAGLALALLLLVLQILLLHTGLLMGMSAPALATLLVGLALGMLEHWQAGGERSRLFAHLASYLPAPVAEGLLTVRAQDGVGAQLVEASVLVADLRNFTAWSETQPPEHVAQLLHRFLTTAVEEVEAHGGQIEALQGDAVLAVWNGLTPCADHPRRALDAAQSLLARIPRELPAADPDSVPPPLALGIGCDAGQVLVGSVGPRRRRQHLALGLPVTRALRLAAMTAELSSPILLGPGLAARLPASMRDRLASRGDFLLEGLTSPCEVYALP